jgi:hypothetical protein
VKPFNLLNLYIRALLGIEHLTNPHPPSHSHPSIKVQSPIMTRASPQTWLEKLEEQLNVDVDWMDPTYSKNLPIKPNDQTSNNLWVNQQMSHPENKEMVLQVCKELKSEGWKAAYTRIVSFSNV